MDNDELLSLERKKPISENTADIVDENGERIGTIVILNIHPVEYYGSESQNDNLEVITVV